MINRFFVRYGDLMGSDLTITKEQFVKNCEEKGIDPYDYGVENFVLRSIIHGAPHIVLWDEKAKEYHRETFSSGVFAYPFDIVSDDMITCKYHQRSRILWEKCDTMYKGREVERVKRLVEKELASFKQKGKEVMQNFLEERKSLLKEYMEVRRKEVYRKKQDKHIFAFVGEVVIHKLQDFLDNPEEDWIGWDIDREPPTPRWGKSSPEEYFNLLENALNQCVANPDNSLHPADFEVFLPCPIGDGTFFKEVINM